MPRARPGGTGGYSTELAGALAAKAPAGSPVTPWTAFHRDVTAARARRGAAPPPAAAPPAARRGVGAGGRPGPPRHVGARPDAAVSAAPGRALVVTIHDTVPWTHPETLTPRGARWHRAVVQRATREADALVVPTQAVAEDLARHVALRRPPTVAGLGVSLSRSPADAHERAAAARPARRPYLLTLATLEPRKGLDVLLAALAGRKRRPPSSWSATRGGERSTPEARPIGGASPGGSARSDVSSDSDLAVVLSRAAALVAPSRAEGFGLPGP